MRHDGAMLQQNASVWKGASSLAAAKAELCKGVAPEDDGIRSRGMRSVATVGCARTASGGGGDGLFTRFAALVRGDRGGDRGAPLTYSTRSRGIPAARLSRSAPMKMKKGGATRGVAMEVEETRGVAMDVDFDESLASSGASEVGRMYGEVVAASAPEKATSLKSNVLVEDEISFEQVKRIMARKSAK